MKTTLCLLFVSFSVLAQPKNTQRYQIVTVRPIENVSAVIMVDGETGRSWHLILDTVDVVSNTGTYKVGTHLWEPLPLEKVSHFNSDTRELILSPEEKKK
ncbi:MAG: hypothetical protein WBZ48_02830 [Bacteroidota bacterium]